MGRGTGVDLALCMGPPPEPFSPVVAQRPPLSGRLPGSPVPSWLIRAAPGRGPLGTSLGLGAYLNVGRPRAGAVTERVP